MPGFHNSPFEGKLRSLVISHPKKIITRTKRCSKLSNLIHINSIWSSAFCQNRHPFEEGLSIDHPESVIHEAPRRELWEP